MSRRTSLALAIALSLAGCASSQALTPSAPRSITRGQSPEPAPQPAVDPAFTTVAGGLTPLLLRDVIRIAIENSTVFLTLSGDVQLAGLTSLDPAIARSAIGQEEGRFNPRLATGVIGSRVDEPPNSFYGPGISTETRYNEANFYARLAQPLTTGGEASIAYDPSLAYLYFPEGVTGTQFNPAYSADFVFRLKQPVLRNAGAARTLTGIQVARARADQTQWDLQSALNSLIRSLSEAYWSLLAARVQLQAIDSVIPLARESVRLEKLRYNAEQVIQADVARAEVAVEELIRERAQAVQEYRRRNYQINQLMGRLAAQANEIVPIDLPVREWLAPDPLEMSSIAVERLPELGRLRKQLEIRSLQLNVARKDRLPDVNLLGEYRTGGLGTSLGDALDQSSSFGFPTWTLGVTLEYPLGNGTARSRSQAAEMELTRDQLVLRTSEERARYNIAKLIAGLEASWERHESADRQVAQSQEWLRLSGIRYRNPLPTTRGGNWLLLALVDYQNAMRGYVEAVTAASETLAEYNIALARLDEAQGISMDRWQILLAESLPPSSETQGQTFVAGKGHVTTQQADSPPRQQPQPAVQNAAEPAVQQATWTGHSSYRYQHLRHGR